MQNHFIFVNTFIALLASALSSYLPRAMLSFIENGLLLKNVVLSHSLQRRYNGRFLWKNIPEKNLFIYLKFLSDNFIAKSSDRTEKIESR